MGDPSVVHPLFERMRAEGHAAFTLASVEPGLEPAEGRETELVEAAIVAGVIGALSVLKDDPEH